MITIRKEEPGDIRAIRHVNELAFDQENEANIIEELRKRGALTISLVVADYLTFEGQPAYEPREIFEDEP